MTIALEGIVALVTGANGGIGREVVKAMKAAGATVIASDLADTDESGADHYFRHDVSKPEDWQQIAAFVKTEFGHLDALVNNAGISTVASFEETPLSEFHRINSVNLDSIVIGTQALMEMLKAGGKRRESGAAVVNFSSVGAARRSTLPIAPARPRSRCSASAPARSSPRWDTTSASTACIPAGSIPA